jgi:uncharacterized SAM-binding protein YcdF (DUF218 family)
MSPGALKPILTAFALPPAAPLLLVLLGLLVLAATKRRRTGIALALAGTASLWLLSCHAFALLLTHALLPAMPAVQPAQVAQVQAIVVLGGGVRTWSPEFGVAQPSPPTLGRLRYGAWLAQKTGKPLAFSGGIGWAARDGAPPEAQAAAAALADWGVPLRWNDARSRDTAENARETKRLLGKDGISRIALVTDAWHLPRSVLEFERAGFQVLPAPTGLPAPSAGPLLEWLPSAEGLSLSRAVLREALGLVVARATQLFS